MSYKLSRDQIAKIPFLTTALLESANGLQLWRMWTTGTAEGQNVWGWICVNLALILWLVWYHEFTPDQRFAIWATRGGIVINACVIVTTLYLQQL